MTFYVKPLANVRHLSYTMTAALKMCLYILPFFADHQVSFALKPPVRAQVRCRPRINSWDPLVPQSNFEGDSC